MTDTTQRAAFEAWAISEVFAVHRNGGEQYVNTATQHAWTGWQASRKQALAEAAALCEHLENNRDDGHGGFGVTGEDCCFAIRRLSTPEGGL